MGVSVYHTEHYVNQIVTQFLSKSQNYEYKNLNEYILNKNETFCSYGILRGTGEIFLNSKKYIYMDHGYFNSSLRKFTKDKKTIISNLSGYFRVLANDFYFNKNFDNIDTYRFKNLKIDLKDLKKNTDHIILSEPSENTINFLKIPNWTKETLNEIKKYTDRKIIIHNKFSEVPLESLLEKAFAFVSLQSTAGFNCLTNGIPAYFTHDSLKKYSDIKNIEDRKLNHNLLYMAANSQWKLKEFFSDEFKEYMSIILK